MRPFISPMLLGGLGSTFLVGNNAAATTGVATAGDFQQGVIAQAVASGTCHNFVFVTTGSGSGTFRLCAYNASSSTVISGSLLGKTADQTSAASGVNIIPVVTPFAIVSGNWYGVMLHSGTFGVSSSANTAYPDRAFADTYSDGPLDPASSSGPNSGNGRIIYLTL